MRNKRYKPKLDKLFFIIFIPTLVLMLGVTLVPGILESATLFWTLPIDVFVFYFFISSLFGYVELREKTLFIKYGFILKKEIPYEKIRKIRKDKKFYSESMMSLKNSFEHVNITYNSFDVTAVSVKDNDAFIKELEARRFTAKDFNEV